MSEEEWRGGRAERGRHRKGECTIKVNGFCCSKKRSQSYLLPLLPQPAGSARPARAPAASPALPHNAPESHTLTPNSLYMRRIYVVNLFLYSKKCATLLLCPLLPLALSLSPALPPPTLTIYLLSLSLSHSLAHSHIPHKGITFH